MAGTLMTLYTFILRFIREGQCRSVGFHRGRSAGPCEQSVVATGASFVGHTVASPLKSFFRIVSANEEVFADILAALVGLGRDMSKILIF